MWRLLCTSSTAVDGSLYPVRFLVVECGADAAVKEGRGWVDSAALSDLGGRVTDSCGARTAFLVAECGTSVAAQDDRGWIPLHWAWKIRHVDLARFIVDHSADTVAQDNGRLTPLHQHFIYFFVFFFLRPSMCASGY
jgi:hypothetical protein